VSETSNAIVVDGITKRFGPTLALDNVSFTVGDGEFVVMSGPSGSGKSTMLQLIAGLERPDKGTITVSGRPISRRERSLNDHRRNRVGIVFQLHNLVPRLTAQQNVELAMFGTGRSRKQRTERACELLAVVGLESKSDHVPPNMSGGERQRVAIARALANDPPVLLADEPSGSLDDESAEQVLEVLARLRRDSALTVFAASHDPRLNARADRAIRLIGAHIAEETVDLVDTPRLFDPSAR
jgi:ABC-type lipoprotein export system ATPase subunit